ncbi:WbqC family protein [Brevibacillus sp. 179-C 1.1 NHS]|uniref:WbqC family protein n=1 Tax=Brevibacillus sp. 179-C 1.1 NHS TaxID=3235177 RepID=UPI0039A25378
MRVAIMQPYLFPYIGYFQLIHAVDTFVIFDDVNYITRGWINRNYVLLNEKKHLFTLPLNNASQNRLIKETTISKEYNNRNKILRLIEQAYKKAPNFNVIFPMISGILLNQENNLSKYISNSLSEISKYLEIQTNFLHSSEHFIEKSNLKGQNRIIEICKAIGATEYINAIGGRELYDKEFFSLNSITLSFVETDGIVYKQFNNEFVPYLSIIDSMMFLSKEEIISLVHKYKLI